MRIRMSVSVEPMFTALNATHRRQINAMTGQRMAEGYKRFHLAKKLIAKMESSFAAKWKAKQKRMGIKFGPVPNEDDDFTNILSAKKKGAMLNAARTSTGGATGMVGSAVAPVKVASGGKNASNKTTVML